MPRVHANSGLRNRNKVTNKTKLKIFHGNIEAGPLIYGEDETPSGTGSLFLNTHEVDAHDANEHHLQAALSAASKRHQNNSLRSTRSATEKSNDPAVFIPVPDSTGAVDDYEELYPPSRWTDPVTYARSSETVEESISGTLCNGFTYYMDERDNEWLEKSNEEARGEGTSAQGALLTPGAATRSGLARSAKAKGKEPEVQQPVVISDDEFELVMGLFEKVTHEKTEYLHHSLDTGMAFPAFSEYQDTFSSQLSPSNFAAFSVPPWVPPPNQLVRIAKIVYSYWKERRLERSGHRIIPTLNFDETDTLNESYVCFRRLELKAVRKTRASQATFSDKLVRLQSELSVSLELAKFVVEREKLKKESAKQSQNVWEKRLNVAELKRKFPMLGDKGDEELLQDKERKTSKPDGRLPGLKLRTHGDPNTSALYAEAVIRPRERRVMIQSQIERELQLQKEKDHQWEDQIDNLYQQLPVPYTSRLYKWVPPPETQTSTDDGAALRTARSVRMRVGRGGRLLIDRRNIPRHASSFGLTAHDPNIDKRSFVADDYERRLSERWKYDTDDHVPGPDGSDEQDRVLIDDYAAKYLRYAMSLLSDLDQASLTTDPFPVVDVRQQSMLPFRLQQPVVRRDTTSRPHPPGHQPPSSLAAQHGNVSVPVQPTSATPVSVPTPVKRMQPPASVPQMRISSNGGMRPTLAAATVPSNPPAPQPSPSHNPVPIPQANGINGIHRSGSNTSQHEVVKTETTANTQSPDAVAQDTHAAADVNGAAQAISPLRPKSQNQHHINGYHLAAMNGYSTITNGSQFLHLNNGLSIQQMQNLKSTFASIPTGQDGNAVQPNAGRQMAGSFINHAMPNGANFDVQLGAGANMILKLPPTRQTQWAISPLQRPMTVNGIDSAMVNGSMSPNLNHAHALAIGPPARTPSANGTRANMRGVTSSIGHAMGTGQLGTHAMSPHLQHSPSSLPMSLSQVQNQPSPPRLPQTPTMTMVSPHQPPVASSQSGY